MQDRPVSLLGVGAAHIAAQTAPDAGLGPVARAFVDRLERSEAAMRQLLD